jgi:serine phosphatase RsbU (regulator of sigma subunit)
MFAVHALSRHLVPASPSPAATLAKLNDALAATNPSSMFVTLAHGIYDPRTGEVVLASGGHPPPLVRRASGQVEEIAVPAGRLIGCMEGDPHASDIRVTLGRGETLILYSDGYTEACAPDGKTMFGTDRLRELLGGARSGLPLEQCAEEARQAIERFTGSPEQQDDLTLLLIRRM